MSNIQYPTYSKFKISQIHRKAIAENGQFYLSEDNHVYIGTKDGHLRLTNAAEYATFLSVFQNSTANDKQAIINTGGVSSPFSCADLSSCPAFINLESQVNELSEIKFRRVLMLGGM